MAQGLHLLNTIIFKYVYWYMKQISGERLQDHWSSGSPFDQEIFVIFSTLIECRLKYINQIALS